MKIAFQFNDYLMHKSNNPVILIFLVLARVAGIELKHQCLNGLHCLGRMLKSVSFLTCSALAIQLV